MHTWAVVISDDQDTVEVEDLEDDFTLIIDTETTEGKNILKFAFLTFYVN